MCIMCVFCVFFSVSFVDVDVPFYSNFELRIGIEMSQTTRRDDTERDGTGQIPLRRIELIRPSSGVRCGRMCCCVVRSPPLWNCWLFQPNRHRPTDDGTGTIHQQQQRDKECKRERKGERDDKSGLRMYERRNNKEEN